MAYRVSKIDYVPDIPEFDFYVFILGKSWSGGSLEEVEKNLNSLGERMSGKGAVVRGHDDDELRRELSEAFPSPGFGSRDFNDFVGLGHSDGSAMFITSSHPNSFVAEDDFSIYIPLRLVFEKYESIDDFYEDLCGLVVAGDEKALKKFIDLSNDGSCSSAFRGALEIKPGFMGISFNLIKFFQKLKGPF